MTGRLFRSAFFTGILILLLSCSLFLTGLYRYHEEQVFRQLAMEMDCVANGVELMGSAYLETLETEERLTWIGTDGAVLYDSEADQTAMDNHLDGEEVLEALDSGAGRSIRDSDTVMEKTLYYAEKMADGTVLRLSRRQETAAAVLLQMSLPLMMLVVLADAKEIYDQIGRAHV